MQISNPEVTYRDRYLYENEFRVKGTAQELHPKQACRQELGNDESGESATKILTRALKIAGG